MAESPRRRILAHVRLADICCVIGLALNFMWCSLEGHALRFAETAAQFQFPLNPRGFWLMGFCLLALLYLAVPHWLKRWENTLKGHRPALRSRRNARLRHGAPAVGRSAIGPRPRRPRRLRDSATSGSPRAASPSWPVLARSWPLPGPSSPPCF